MDMNDQFKEQSSKDSRSSFTMVEALTRNALRIPDKTALIFLSDGENPLPEVTYSMFHDLAMRFAAGITKHVGKGDRVVLLFQSSYEFAVAFFGCLYAGVIAIPLPIPSRRSSDWIRMDKIISDSDTKLVVTYGKVIDRLTANASKNMRGTTFNMHLYEDLIDGPSLVPIKPSGTDIAFLQYTSGSTGSPKGVMISHNNLIENQALLQKGFRSYGSYGETAYFSWLPLFHDMGLIGHFLQSVYLGQPFIFMAPNAFLQKPVRWLKAISRYRTRVSGAPNFAYELCAERITEEDKKGLDLSCWEVAFNGAEPVRATTLEKFNRAFKDYGIKETTLYPCYGSAEATLIISGGIGEGPPIKLRVDRSSYENDRIVLASPDSDNERDISLVSSGKALIDGSVAIVCPDTRKVLPPLHVGEIWLSGPCNGLGYWNNGSASEATFMNRISDMDDSKDYLNTGDLGFVDEANNIYITGRSKDLLIFNGRNIYPQDIELCSSSSDPALRESRCAAISIYDEENEKEKLILVHELDRVHAKKANYNEVIDNIRSCVYREFGIPVSGVSLVYPSTIPITSSGKIRRQACRQQYMKAELSVVSSWPDTSNESGNPQVQRTREVEYGSV